MSGGYDQENNQVVLCENNCKTQGKIEDILAHELIHMYDYCTAKINFQKISHLACSEVRASSLVSCAKPNFSYVSHESCVKSKAADSVKLIKNLSPEEASLEVKKIFQKCYNDLEPLGSKYSKV